MAKKKGFYAELSAGKKKVIYLEPSFYQGGKWYKLNSKAGRKRLNAQREK